MRQSDCSFGGELSGHFFFKDMQYADAAILAMLRLVELLVKENKPLSQLVAPMRTYANSGEVNIEVQSEDRKVQIIEQLKNRYSDGKQNFLDGITVEYPDWWFNVRFSNTEPIVRIVVEADTQELMKEKVREITSEIKKPPK